MILAILTLPGFLFSQSPTVSQTGTITNGISGVFYVQTNRDAVFSISNFGTAMPIYTFSPAPYAFTLPPSLTSTGAAVYPTLAPVAEIITALTTNGGRTVGHQFAVTYPQSVQSNFVNFVTNSLNYSLWTNCIGSTNGKTATIWTARAHPPAAASWNASGILSVASNFTGLSYANEMEPSAGQFAITALSRRIGYTRGHGAGAVGTNADNAGRQVWYLTAANATVTNTVSEQITSTGTDVDFTIFRFETELPQTITPLPMVAFSEIQEKRPGAVCAPAPNYAISQGNSASCGVAPFPFPGVTGGDSGLPVMLLHSNRLVFYAGLSTSGWSPTFSNACRFILQRGGLSLTNMPEVMSFSNYPTL